jgi:hypothetical protein
VKNSPYVQRLVEDEELRANIAQAYDSARSAANRFSNGKSPTKAVFDDKKLQKDVRELANSLRDASIALREGPQKRRRGGLGKFILVGLVGAGLALALSEGLRKKVLDTLFGAEEEFEYSSATTASPPVTPAQPAGSTS